MLFLLRSAIEFSHRYRKRRPNLATSVNFPVKKLSEVSETKTQIHSISISRMTSNNPIPTGPPRTETDLSASAPLIIFVLSPKVNDWSNGGSLLAGNNPKDEYCGKSKAYRSLATAHDTGEEWAFQQLQVRLNRYMPPLATEEHRSIAFDAWLKSEPQQGDA